MKKSLLILAMMLTVLVTSAQTWSNQILSSTDNGAAIYSPNWNYGVGAAIYTASELNLPASELSGIAFKRYTANLSTSNTQAVKIYLAHTNLSAFSNSYAVPPTSQMTLVYDGDFTHPMGANVWAQITFDIPFQYDGTSNLLICFVNTSGSMIAGNEFPYYHTNTSRQQSRIIANSDNNPVTPDNVSTAASSVSTNSERPVLQLRYETEPAEIYNISIGDTEITEDNCTNVTDEDLTSGTVTFDPTTNTLTLDNITLSGYISAEYFDRGNLNVVVRGNCVIERTIYCPESGVSTTVTGTTNDILKVAAFSMRSDDVAATLTINDLTVIVGEGNGISECSSQYALYGYGNEHIVLNNVELSSWALECPFDEFLSITLNDCHIAYPVGAAIENGCIRVNGNHSIDSAHIARDMTPIEIVADRDFTLAPNPAVDIVEFQGLDLNGTASVSIYNAEGKLVAGIEVSDARNLRMDINNLATGIYTVQVIGNHTRYTSKLVKK